MDMQENRTVEWGFFLFGFLLVVGLLSTAISLAIAEEMISRDWAGIRDEVRCLKEKNYIVEIMLQARQKELEECQRVLFPTSHASTHNQEAWE